MTSVALALKHSPPPVTSISSRSSKYHSFPVVLLPLSLSRPIPIAHGLLPRRTGSSFKGDTETPLFTCFCKSNDDLETSATGKMSARNWPVLERWEVPWEWQTVVVTMLACGSSFTLTGLAEVALLPYLGFQDGALSLDGKAGLLFAGQLSATVAVLVVLLSITNKFRPFGDDILRYDLRRPFDLKDGWLLWAVVGLLCAMLAIYLTGVALSIVNGEDPKRETDALVRLLPLLGSSTLSMTSLLATVGILAPLLEETVFRGFFMASLTKWYPTPVAVFLSAAAFALAHLTPGEFPQLFVLGTVLGFSYAQTRNLLTPITIHALWNSGVIILLTILELQGYDIRELLQASS